MANEWIRKTEPSTLHQRSKRKMVLRNCLLKVSIIRELSSFAELLVTRGFMILIMEV
jgi:hypothetical protein